MRVSSGSNILHGYVHNDYIVNNNLTIFRCINNEGLIVIKPYVSRFVTLLKDRQGYVRPEWRHFLIAHVVFFVRHSIDTDNLPFPSRTTFSLPFVLFSLAQKTCIISLARTKGSSLYAVLVRSTVVNPSLSVLISSSQTHWQRKRVAFNGPQASSHISSIKPQYVAYTLPFSSSASKRTPSFWYVLFPSYFFV